MFPTQALLHSHLISSAHRRLTVLCPWCVGREKTFTRIHDLEVHVRTTHTSVVVTKDKFTRANGFYLAKHPKDYARIVDKIGPYNSDVAREARNAVRTWAESFDDSQVRADKWNTGWKAGVEIASSKAKPSKSRSISREKSTGADSRRVVEIHDRDDNRRSRDFDNAEKRDGRNESRKFDTEKGRDEDLRNDSERRGTDTGRDRDREMNINRDRVTTTNRERDRGTDTSRDRDRETNTERDRETDTSKEKHREMNTNRERDRLTKDTHKERERDADTIRDRDREMNTDKDRVTNTNRERDRVTNTHKERDRENESHKDKEAASSRSRETDTSRDKGADSSTGKEANTDGDKVKNTRRERLSEINTYTDRDKAKNTNNNRKTDTHTERERETNTSRDRTGDKEGENSKKRDRSNAEEQRKSKQRKIDEGFENYVDNIELGEEAAVPSFSSSGGSSPTSSSSSSCSNSTTISQPGFDNGLKARAQRILMKGFMPVCPPARRDWTTVEEFSLESMGIKVNWPPENWNRMTPDQKLMSHEFISMFLEKTLGNGFPLLSRRALLDKYNFMALEGEGRPQEEADSGDKTDAKIRYYNYSYIKCVARGEVQDTRMSRSLVNSIEGACRWADTDHITEKLDASGVKLKI